MQQDSEDLLHFGKIGMRWGVHRAKLKEASGKRLEGNKQRRELDAKFVSDLKAGKKSGLSERQSIDKASANYVQNKKALGILPTKTESRVQKIKDYKVVKETRKAEAKMDKPWVKDAMKKKVMELSNDPKVVNDAVSMLKGKVGLMGPTQFNNAFTVAMASAMNRKLEKGSGTSPSGKRKLQILVKELDGQVYISPNIVVGKDTPTKKPTVKHSAELDDVLLHFGKKGMRWGVTNRIKDEISSAKREKSWEKSLRTSSTMSNEKLKNTVERIRLENSLKTLGKRKEYLKRADVSAEDLKKRVDRLQLERNLKTNISVATKKQKAIGKEITDAATRIGMATLIKKESLSSALMTEVMTQITRQVTSNLPSAYATVVNNAIKDSTSKEKP